MSRRVPEARVLVLASAREEELVDASLVRGVVRELCRLPQTMQLTLSPLSRSDTVLLARSLAGASNDAGTVARLDQQVWEVSEGNPFVAVETTRALQQGVLTLDSASLPLSQRVRDLVSHRLDPLTEQGRQLAAVAAVIGREFEFALLQAASGLDAEPAAAAVEELVRRRVLHGIEERFDFTHERVRAVVLDQVLSPRRKLLERRVGEALEAVYAAHIEPHSLSLGLHYLHGESWDRAVIFLERAGLAAAGRSAYREAVASFHQAMGALGHLPEGPDTARREVELRLGLHSVHAVLGNVDQMFALLREAEPIAAGLGDRRLEVRVASQMALCLWWTGHPALAVDTGQRALTMAETLRDVELEAVTRARLAFACMDLGDYRRAVELYQKNIGVLVGDLTRARFDMSAVPAVTCRGFLATCLGILGDFARAFAWMDEALEFAEATSHPYTVAWAHTEAGRLRVMEGDWGSAIERLERSLELCRREGFAYLFPNAATFLGHAYTRCGRISDGIALLEEAVEQSATIRYMASHPRGAAHLAEGYLLAGRLCDAMQAGRRALELSRSNRQRGFEAEALRILGDVKTAHDAPDDTGLTFFHEALALARDLGMRPLEAHCYLGLGRLLRRTRDLATARVLARARAMFEEMGMGFWLKQAEAELAATPANHCGG